jgi:hypothetical protein
LIPTRRKRRKLDKSIRPKIAGDMFPKFSPVMAGYSFHIVLTASPSSSMSFRPKKTLRQLLIVRRCEHYSRTSNEDHYFNASIGDGSYNTIYLAGLQSGQNHRKLPKSSHCGRHSTWSPVYFCIIKSGRCNVTSRATIWVIYPFLKKKSG